jgi:tRNA dimethylallyltransferase
MVLFLVGPTACGKTDLAVELAQRINGEIVSCDSMQVYKEMSILNSKPKTTQLKKIAHHLIGSVSVSNDYNVTKYRKGALTMMGKILRKEKVPLFVGGSGLYVKVLLDGIFETDTEDKKIRDRLYAQAQRQGKDKLFSKLKKIDPPAATKIHPHDLRRIVRALEVYEVTKVPISVWQKRRRGIIDDFDVRIFGMEREKTDLYKRIDRRLNLMFKKGLLKEVKKLLGLKLSKTVKQALGVKEIKGYLNGLYSLKDAKDMLKINTYRLVKKQSTWFRKEKRINWIKVKDFETDKDIAKRIIKKL